MPPQITPSAASVDSVRIPQSASRHGSKRGLLHPRKIISKAELDTQPRSGSGNHEPDDGSAETKERPGQQEGTIEIDDATATKRTIFVGNIPANTKRTALKALFSQCVVVWRCNWRNSLP